MKTIISNTLCIIAISLPIVLMCFDSLLCLFFAVVLFSLVVYNANNFQKPWKQLYTSFVHVMQVFVK